MNREIKFRAWVKYPEGSVMKEVYGFNSDFVFVNTHSDYRHAAQYFSNCILLQYTGLKDKSGKEIYEGDILNTHCFYQGLGENMGVIECEREFITVVEYYQNDCAFILTDTKNGDLTNFSEIQEPSEELEIIGNIYENPELLK